MAEASFELVCVFYFEQQTGASYDVCRLKSSFSTFLTYFKLKNRKKGQKLQKKTKYTKNRKRESTGIKVHSQTLVDTQTQVDFWGKYDFMVNTYLPYSVRLLIWSGNLAMHFAFFVCDGKSC